MTFRPAFPAVAVEYIRQNINEWPKVLAYKIGRDLGYRCTPRGVRQQIRQLKKEAAHGSILR